MVSKKLKIAVKLGDEPAYKIAQRAGVNPATLSKLICGITPVRKGDPRIVAVGRLLGIPENECFGTQDETSSVE